MRYFRSLLGAAMAVPLLLAGCSNPAPPPSPPPLNPSAQAESDAVQRKIEELKKSNPNLPPTAIGTMAMKMVQQEKAARGGASP